MRLSASTNAYVRHPLAEAVERIGKLGFSGVEILADAPHAFPLPLAPAPGERLAAALAEAGLPVANVNANTAMGFFGDAPPESFFEPSLASPRRDHRAWRARFTRDAIDLAVRVGAPCVSVTTGRPLVPPAEAMRNLRASLDAILPYAAERGVRVAIEYEPGLLVESAEEILTLLDDVAHPALAANLDVAHAVVNREDLRAVARALGKRLAHVHVADVRGRKHYHLVPGEGDIHWPSALDALASAGYHGFVTLELYTYADRPDAALGAGLMHLQRALADPCRSSSPMPT